ncbi:hypothetical protein [Cupriavidus yeoncheonensis]|uniref:hypothetical protein n=1 Tax=Cupriavidus yeoncheonensis TaxID=1462994 RepID=UPI001BAAF78A|nr:hypothetical protein [Cupriavidus yeoncheonensis]
MAPFSFGGERSATPGSPLASSAGASAFFCANFTMWEIVLAGKIVGLQGTTQFLMMKDSVPHHEMKSVIY